VFESCYEFVMGQNRLFRAFHFLPVIIVSIAATGCMPSAQAVLNEVLSFDEGVAARVERVQQYEDRMPTTVEEGAPAPGQKWVTLIDVEIEACPGAKPEDFELALKESERAILIQVRPVGEVRVCSERSRQHVSLSTSEISPGRALIVANPLPIDALGPAD
jgi:hypothetical protein